MDSVVSKTTHAVYVVTHTSTVPSAGAVCSLLDVGWSGQDTPCYEMHRWVCLPYCAGLEWSVACMPPDYYLTHLAGLALDTVSTLSHTHTPPTLASVQQKWVDSLFQIWEPRPSTDFISYTHTHMLAHHFSSANHACISEKLAASNRSASNILKRNPYIAAGFYFGSFLVLLIWFCKLGNHQKQLAS